MSTSLLYHAFGIRGYDYLSTAYEDGHVRFTIGQRRHTYRCPACGAREVAPRGCQQRTFQAAPSAASPWRSPWPSPAWPARPATWSARRH